MQRRLRFSNRVQGTRTGVPPRRILLTAGVAVLVGSVWAGADTPIDTPYRNLAGPGHGRGLSQFGAFDSAREGWNAERILAHYYPGATLGAIPTTSLGIRLSDRDDEGVDVRSAAGLRVAGREVAADQVAHLTVRPDGKANVVVTAGCDGDVLWQSATDDPWVYPLDPRPGRPAAEHLTFCDGAAYRGSLGLAVEDGATRTVNRVDVEDYLLGVVPAEVQANWADEGAREAVRAQAVAARSYALAEQRWPYARTCDTTDCQVYPGTSAEDERAADAVASTAGTVLLRDGHILRAEYSAAPDGGEPADIRTFEVGPTPAELGVGAPPALPRARTATVESAIDAEYRRVGGEHGAIGPPLGPEMRLPQNAGDYRLFTNGVIIATPTLGAQVVDFTTLMQLVPDPGVAQPDPTAPQPDSYLRPDAEPDAEPSETGPTGAQPAESDPAGVESAESEPVVVEPAESDPAGVESAESEPAGVEPAESEPPAL